uniref:AAA+ ATPase domain-containing protein n=1 Tax=Strigamia maritima TaxID=126957 RepID=T1JNZ9_STRMM
MADTCNLNRDSNCLNGCFDDNNMDYQDYLANRMPRHSTVLRDVLFKQSGSATTPIPNYDASKHIQNEDCKSSKNTVTLSLVFASIADVLKYTKHKERLIPSVKTSLTSSEITENDCVQMTNTAIHSVYHIERIIIDSIPTRVFIVNKQTKIIIDKLISKDEHDLLEKDIKLGGIEEKLEVLTTLLTLPDDETCRKFALDKTIKSSALLYGPPGTGKTSLIKKVAVNLNLRLVHLDCIRLFQSSIAESEEMLKSVFKTAIDLSRIDTCVLLFLDQIDTICSSRRSNSWMGKRLVAQLQLLLDSMAATNQIDSLDPSLRHSKYFDQEILIGIPNSVQREEILKVLINDHELLDFHHLAQSTPGYTPADLKSLSQRLESEEVINTDSITELLKNLKCTSKRMNSEFNSTKPPVKWDDIGGLVEVKNQIRQMLDLRLNKPHVLAHYNLPKPKGILLYGPPGCCKTTLIHAAASDLQLNFLSITPSDIYSPYLGESEKAISQVFRKARLNSPTILFFDELDSFVGSRVDAEQSAVHAKVLSALLNEMDGIGINVQEITNDSVEDGGALVMAATNRPDLIDPALLRPGRFDAMMYIPPPDKQGRKSILEILLKKVRTGIIDLDKLADLTEFYSGVDFSDLCTQAFYKALDEDLDADLITQQHFEAAISEKVPSLSQEQIDFFTRFNKR